MAEVDTKVQKRKQKKKRKTSQDNIRETVNMIYQSNDKCIKEVDNENSDSQYSGLKKKEGQLLSPQSKDHESMNFNILF